MTRINASALCAGVLTTLVLCVMSHFPQVPLWAMFIAWACFFHLGGGEQAASSARMLLSHMGTGVLLAWCSALLILVNPWTQGLPGYLWAPLITGLIIAAILRASAWHWLSITPPIIYGFAAVWAYLSVSGRFRVDALLSYSMDNALVTIWLCIVLGTGLGYINARLVAALSSKCLQAIASLPK